MVISCERVFRPLVWAIQLLNEPLGQQSLHVAKEDDVVFTVEVDPAAVAVFRVMALRLAGCRAVEDLVERLMMDISQYDIKILTEGHVTVAMNDETAHDALAAQPQMSVVPLIVERHKVEVLLRVVDALWNLTDEVRGRQQFARRVEEGHRSVDADAHIHAVLLGNVDDKSHIIEVVPGRQAEHQRQRHLVLHRLHHLNHPVVAVAAPHPLVSLAATVERDVQMPGLMAADDIGDLFRRQPVGEQRVVRVMLAEPRHYFRGLRVEDELAALQSYGRPFGDALALHDSPDVVERQMFHPLLPDVAMLASRLAGCCRVNHQLRQPLVVRPRNIVQIEEPIIGVIVDIIHDMKETECRKKWNSSRICRLFLY